MMISNKSFSLLTLSNAFRFPRALKLSTSLSEISTEGESSEVKSRTRKTRRKKLSHKDELNQYFQSSEERLEGKEVLPEELLKKKKVQDYLYLIDPSTAQKVATLISPYIKENNEAIIAECFPGPGLLTQKLLDNGIERIRLFEANEDFQSHLEGLANKYPGRLQLFPKDLYRMNYFLFADSRDGGNRVEEIFEDVPKREWKEDPALIIIGPCLNLYFFRYLGKALAMHNSFAEYGRVELLVMMKVKDYLRLLGDTRVGYSNSYMSILFNLVFEYEVIDELPRKAFLPWESKTDKTIAKTIPGVDEDKIYLTRIGWKKELPLPLDELVQFYFFLKHIFSKRKKVIPTLENWVSGCGENIIWPKLDHDDYFEDMDIFTRFKDLSPNQVLSVFREMHEHPSYRDSPFLSMIEEEIVKFETAEIRSDPTKSHLEREILDDIKVELNTK